MDKAEIDISKARSIIDRKLLQLRKLQTMRSSDKNLPFSKKDDNVPKIIQSETSVPS